MVKSCDLEKTTQNQYSPGIVNDNETILRLIISPLHLDPETKEIKPAAFQRKELNKKGASVHRQNYSNEDSLGKLGKKLANRETSRKVAGAVVTKCLAIRKIKDDKSRQCFSLLDTACPDHKGHADIFFSINFSKPYQLKLRAKLIDVFSGLTSLAEVYQ